MRIKTTSYIAAIITLILAIITTLWLPLRVAQAQTTTYFGLSAGSSTRTQTANYLFASKFFYPSMQQKARIPYPTADPGAAVYNNKLYIMGGYGANDSNVLNYCQIYDPSTDSWSQGATMPTVRWACTAAQFNGVIYVFGGHLVSGTTNKCEAYNIASNSWSTKTNVPTYNYLYMAVTCGSYIYLFIGNEVWQFDPTGNSGQGSYTQKASAPVTRWWATSAYVKVSGEDRIYIIGGGLYQGGNPTNTNYYYRPANNDWSSAKAVAPYSSYGQMREQPVSNGLIYYGFGQDTTSQFYDSLYRYDPSNNTWSSLLCRGAVARDGLVSGVINNVLYAVGGRNVYSSPFGLDVNESYDTTVDAMQTQSLASISMYFDDSTPNGSVRMGIYNDSSGSPGNLLLDAGAISVANGWVNKTGLNLSLASGYYWLAFVMSADNNIRVQTGYYPTYAYRTYSYAALPTPFGSLAGTQSIWDVIKATVTSGTTNTAPVAVNDTYSCYKDIAYNMAAPGVLGNDTDINGDTLTATKVTNPSNGTVTLNSDGSFVYTPATGYTGTDSFTYKANDGKVDSNVATVTITINEAVATFGLNNGNNSWSEDQDYLDAMRFQNDAGTGTLTKLELLIDDTRPSGKLRLGVYADNNGTPGNLLLDAGEVTVANGWVSISGSGLAVTQNNYYWLVYGLQSANYVRYQSGRLANSHCWSPSNYGALPSPYPLSGAVYNSNQYVMRATVTMYTNAAPVAVNDAYTTSEDTPLTVAAKGVLTNDTDVDGNMLTAVKVTDPSHGTVTLNSNGSFTYTPTANYNGSDNFTYKANDGTADSNTATVTITITAVNDAPVAVNDAYTTSEDTPLSVAAPGVLSNDTDVDSSTLTAVKVSDPTHGTLTLNNNGSFTYTPTANYNGSDSFTYKANDGSANSNTTTVTITITAVNDAPVAVNDTYTTSKDTPLMVAAKGVLTNDTDVDGDNLTAVIASGPILRRLRRSLSCLTTHGPESGPFQ